MQIMSMRTWAEFRDICVIRKNLTIQFYETANSYEMFGAEAGAFLWSFSMTKSTPPSADQAEFEQTVKPACNYAIGERTYASTTGDFQADDDSLAGAFLKAVDAQTPKITDLYYKFDRVLRVSGGEYWTTGAARGDSVQVDIVDKDGVIVIPAAYGGNGTATFPAGTVLNSYIRNRRLCPVDNQIRSFQRSYWGNPPLNSYLRLRGIILNTTNDVTIDLNLFLHKPI